MYPNTAALLTALTLLGGVVLYTLLWYITLDNHDYYFITPLVLPMVILVLGAWALRSSDPVVFHSPWVKLFSTLLVGYHAVYAANNHEMRTTSSAPLNKERLLPLFGEEEFHHWDMTRYWHTASLMDLEPIARAAGIAPDDLVITVPDESVCIALYFTGQRGYNDFGGRPLDCAEIEKRVKLGAKYLYLTRHEPDVAARLGGCLGRFMFDHRGVQVYDLRTITSP